MPTKPIKIKKKPKDKLIYIYGDEMNEVWEHFNMTVRDDDDRIVLKFVRFESREMQRGSIETARMNVEVYLHNPVGIGEHPNVMAAIQEQLDVIAEQTERIDVLNKYFEV